MKKLLTTLCLVLLVSCSDNPREYYDDSGRLVERSTYIEDKILSEIFYEGGQLSFRGMYKKDGLFGQSLGNKEGTHEWFYKTGVLRTKVNYKEDIREGLLERFYENGQLEHRGKLIGGEREGLWEFFHFTGQLEQKINFEKGKYHGFREYFNLQGQLLSRREFKEGVVMSSEYYDLENKRIIDGVVRDYFPLQPKLRYEIKEGKRNGPYLQFHPNGLVDIRGTYKEGLEEGLWEYFDEDGLLEYTGTYKEGLEEGLWEYFDEDGLLEYTENYKDGVEDGVWKYYEEEGEWTEVYKDGVLIESEWEYK